MGQLEFQRLLPSREIPIHYDVEEIEEDLRTLDRLREPS
jgi:predicted HTH domain antitoxin